MTEKILPIPCTKVEEKTVKDWFSKINGELDELKEAITGKFPLHWCVMRDQYSNDYDYYKAKWETANIAEEAADTITAITSMLEAMGINEEMRQAAQARVNKKNKERGRV